MRVFLAGATGLIGQRMIPLLLAGNHEVIGTTRSPGKATLLSAAGIEPIVVEMFDAAAVMRAVAQAQPDVVVHQLTDLPDRLDPAQLLATLARNAKLRTEATPHLMQAARAAGVRRAVVQSVCFIYAAGSRPHREEDTFDATPTRQGTIAGVRALEQSALGTPGVEGVVLRYGRLWGPGTWTETPTGESSLHLDAAAQVAVSALTRGAAGVYNIAEEDGTVSIAKAQRELGFDPAFRLALR